MALPVAVHPAALIPTVEDPDPAKAFQQYIHPASFSCHFLSLVCQAFGSGVMSNGDIDFEQKTHRAPVFTFNEGDGVRVDDNHAFFTRGQMAVPGADLRKQPVERHLLGSGSFIKYTATNTLYQCLGFMVSISDEKRVHSVSPVLYNVSKGGSLRKICFSAFRPGLQRESLKSVRPTLRTYLLRRRLLSWPATGHGSMGGEV